jgi:hypothetical protein
MTLPATIAPTHRARLAAIRPLVEAGLSRHEIRARLNLSTAQIDATLRVVLGTTSWPPLIPDAVFELPIVADPSRFVVEDEGALLRAMTPDEIAARAAADQARCRAAREHWLELEQQRYRLPRRGRSIDDMPA